MPVFSFECTQCGKTLHAATEFAGRRAKCPKCGKLINVSAPLIPGDKEKASSERVPPILPTAPSQKRHGRSNIPWPALTTGIAAVLVTSLFFTFRGASDHQPKLLPSPTATAGDSVPEDVVVGTDVPSIVGQESGSPEDRNPDPIATARKSVVRLATDHGSMGSGFLLADAETVATNLHVVAGAQTVTASFEDGSEIPVDGFLHASTGLDLAILHLSRPSNSGPLVVAKDDVAAGTADVYAIGMPQGLPFSVSKGVVSAYRLWVDVKNNLGLKEDLHDEAAKWVQTTTPISPGNSGGPLLTASGEVLGINTLTLSSRDAQNLNFSLRSTELLSFLNTTRHHIRDLSLLPESPMPSSKAAGSGGADTGARDREAWDLTADAIGDYLLSDLLYEERVSDAHNPTESKNHRLVAAGAALAAVEKLTRIDEQELNPVLGHYVESLIKAILNRRTALLENNQKAPRNAAGDSPAEIVTIESKAVKSRLEFVHGGDWFGPIRVAEKDLGNWWYLAKQSDKAPGEFPHPEASPPKGGWLYEARFLDICMDAHHRGLNEGGGQVALAYIIRLFPRHPKAEWAAQVLGPEATPERLRELAPGAARSFADRFPPRTEEEEMADFKRMTPVRAEQVKLEVRERLEAARAAPRHDIAATLAGVRWIRKYVLESEDLEAREKRDLLNQIDEAIAAMTASN